MATDLKNGNVFTVAESPADACEALGLPVMTEGEYLANVAPDSIPVDMLVYAQYKGDTELEKRINKDFSALLEGFFNE